MRQVKIIDLEPGLINGVEVSFMKPDDTYKENWFEWTATKLTAEFKGNKVTGGVLNAWKHAPVFTEMEYHEDAEMFYFISGTALMPFAEIIDGKIAMDSVRVVRIRPGTQIVIQAGAAHFVAVAEDDTPLVAVVAAPPMDAPRIPMTEAVAGIK